MALHNTFSIIRLINQTIAMKKKHFLMALIIALCSSPTYAQYVLHIAGNNTSISGGDGEPATTAGFNNTYSICMDAMHNLYVNDNAKVRKIDWVTGIITAIAGGGGAFDTTDNIPATSANLAGAWGLCTNELDGIEYLYIADGRNKIRQVNLTTGIITTVAGSGELGYGGDGGPATAAQLGQPRDVAVDEEGNIYIAEYYNSTVRKVSVATGIITTIAGIATPVSGSYGGDGGPATAALLDRPEGVSLDSSGNIYIADTYNNRIRRIDAVTGNITTVVGIGPTGLGSYGGDGGLATDAALSLPLRAIFDKSNRMYIADRSNLRIRRVDPTTGVISTYAGNGIGTGSISGIDSVGDGGPATSAEVFADDLCIDSCGNLFFVEGSVNVRAVTASGPGLAVCAPPSLGTSPQPTTRERELSVWPNPTSGDITIQSPEAGSFVVYNMVGQQVAAYKVASGATDVRLPAALAGGVYMGVYKADEGGALQTVRVVISR